MKRLVTLLMVIGMLLTSTIVVSAGYPDPGAGSTCVFMQNLSETDSAEINAIFTTGETGGTAATQDVSDNLAPFASARMLYTQFPSTIPNNWAGAVELQATAPLAAVATITWDNPAVSNSRAAGIYKGVDAPDTQAYLPYLAVRPNLQTSRITVQNTETQTVNITIHFYDLNGTQAPQTKTDSIPPKSEKTYRLDVIQPDFSATSGYGSAYVTSDKKIAAIATLHWGANWSYASDCYSGVASGDTTLWIPGAFRRFNAGCGNHASASCYTNFSVPVIQNLGDQPANVTIQFWKSDGTMSHQLTDTIAPKAAKQYNTAIKGTLDQAMYDAMVADLGDYWNGSIKVISNNNQPLTGLCIYYATSTGVSDTMIYDAIRDNQATTKALSFPATYRKRTGGTDAMWSTAVIQNLSNTPGQLDIRFFRSQDGSEVTNAHAVISIPANGTRDLNLRQQVNLPQASLDALGTYYSGAMLVKPVGGSIRIVGQANVFWDGANRAGAYSGFVVP